MACSIVRIENLFVNQVSKPFEKGLSSLGEIVDTIEEVGINASVRKVKIFAPLIRRHARDALYHMSEAKAEAARVNNNLDFQVQKTLNEQRRIREVLAESRSQFIGYNCQLESLQIEERQIEAELSSAQNSLEWAKRTLSVAQDQLENRKTEQNVVAGVGVGLLLIPVVGWLAGGAMIAVSLTVLQENVDEAKKSVGNAEENVRSTRGRLSSKKEQLSDIESNIRRVKGSIDTFESQLYRKEQERRRLIKEIQEQTKLSEEIKRCAHFVDVTFGRTSVMRGTTIAMYDFEPLFLSLKSLAIHFNSSNLLGNRIFRRTINFGDVRRKLRMICSKEPLFAVDDGTSDFLI